MADDDKETRKQQKKAEEQAQEARSISFETASSSDIFRLIAQRLDGLESRIDDYNQSERTNAAAERLSARIGSIESALVRPVLPGIPGGDIGHDTGGCQDCMGTNCCCFEIILNAVRASQMQLEPLDAAAPPGLWTALEIKLFATIDKQHHIGIVHPQTPLSFMKLRKQLAGGPADLYNIGRVINRVYVPKNKKQTVDVFFTAVESDHAAERIIGMKDEYGSATGQITLDCCTDEILARRVELHLTHGGVGGGIAGAIEIDFFARRCCC